MKIITVEKVNFLRFLRKDHEKITNGIHVEQCFSGYNYILVVNIIPTQQEFGKEYPQSPVIPISCKQRHTQ